MNKNNKATKQAKLYVVQTYTGWREPQHETHVVDQAGLLEVQKHAEEVLTIHELGQEVQLQMAVA